MSEGRKMALIPLDMLQRLNKPDLTPIKNPSQDQLVKTMEQMSNVLNDNSIPDDIKSSRYNEKIKDFTVYADKVTSGNVRTPSYSTTEPTENKMFYSLPKTFQQPANILLKELEKFPERVQWDNNTNELTIDGKRMVGSNIIDLVGDVMRNRKTVSPLMYSDAFLQLLADVNVPEEFIRNKSRLTQFRSLKVGDNVLQQQQVQRAKRILNKSSKGKVQKRKQLSNLKQTYNWTNI